METTSSGGSVGILILALGDQNYGKLAANLALSIRVGNPKVKIALAYTKGTMDRVSKDHMKEFDKRILVSKKHYTRSGETEYLRAKLCLDLITPFDTTLFLDSDVLANSSFNYEEFIASFKDDLYIQNDGHHLIKKGEEQPKHYTHWVSLSHVQEVYGEGRYYDLHSECILFQKTDKVKDLFKEARSVYDNLKVSQKMVFNGAIPDELPLSIALLNTKVEIKDNWSPVYCEGFKQRSADLKYVADNHIGYSLGGARLSGKMRQNSKAIIAHVQYKLKTTLYNVPNKSIWNDKRNVA